MRRHYELPTLPLSEVVSYVGDGAHKLVERSLKGMISTSIRHLTLCFLLTNATFVFLVKFMMAVVNLLKK